MDCFVAVLNKRTFIIGQDRHLSAISIFVERVAAKGDVPQNAAERDFEIFRRESRFRWAKGKNGAFSYGDVFDMLGNSCDIQLG